jgi:hypothetical protein
MVPVKAACKVRAADFDAHLPEIRPEYHERDRKESN